MKCFNPVETVEIKVDASSSGLGACLMQGNQHIQYASRAVTETENAIVELRKRCLVLFMASLDSTPTLMVEEVTIYNDHKPLAAVLKKPIADSPVRLQRMLCRIMG